MHRNAIRSIHITNSLLVLGVIAIIFTLGYRLGEQRYTPWKADLNKLQSDFHSSNPTTIDFSLFWDTWGKVEERFVDKNKLDRQKMYYGAIKGMVASLEDPYTFFLTPEENQRANDDLDGKFEGIGAELGLRDGRIIIVAPLTNSPAAKAGIKANDVIIKVDDEPTQGWTLLQAVSKIRGEEGTEVVITVLRNAQEKDIAITRGQIKVDSVELKLNESLDSCETNCAQVAYLKLNQFGKSTNEEWNNAIDSINRAWQEGTIEGLVFDMRGNPGGFLDSAVYLASEFLPFGKLIVKQESTSSQLSREYRVVRFGRLQDVPLVILINEGSASASEIVAGAIRDHDRAQLVGKKTFGKGSVQEAIDIGPSTGEGRAGLHVTIAKWILPGGEWINEKGIEPNIEVDNEVENGNTLRRETDRQLEKAVELLVQ